jgi:hypothetical protein
MYIQADRPGPFGRRLGSPSNTVSRAHNVGTLTGPGLFDIPMISPLVSIEFLPTVVSQHTTSFEKLFYGLDVTDTTAPVSKRLVPRSISIAKCNFCSNYGLRT